MRKFKCYECGGLFNSFYYRKDSSPSGEDEAVCPICGAVEAGATEVEVEEDESNR